MVATIRVEVALFGPTIVFVIFLPWGAGSSTEELPNINHCVPFVLAQPLHFR